MDNGTGKGMRISISLETDNIDNEICEYGLSCHAVMDGQGMFLPHSVWERTDTGPIGPDYDLAIHADYVEERWNVRSIEKGKGIRTEDERIIALFESAMLEISMQRLIDIADGLDPEENAGDDQTGAEPCDPRMIRVETMDLPVFRVHKMIKEGKIDLPPDLRGGIIWSDIRQRSRLIESLLLRIPLPAFYLAQDESGMYQVVDGAQRLMVLRDFLGNRFRLRGLECLKDCNGKWFSDRSRPAGGSLDRAYVRRIEQAVLSFHVIDPQTPPQARYGIARRVNVNYLPLSF